MRTTAKELSTAAAQPGQDYSASGGTVRRRATVQGAARLYRALWHFAAGRRWRMAASSSLLVTSQVVKLAIPWLAAKAINTLQLDGVSGLGQAGLWMLAILAVCAASWSMHGPGRVIERSVSIRVRSSLADTLYARLASCPLLWHESHHTGETIHRVEKTTAALADFAQSQFIYLQNFVSLCGPVVALLVVSPILGTTAAAGYAAIGIVIVVFDRAMMRLVERQNQAERHYAAGLLDYLGNIGTVVSLRLQGVTRDLLGARLARVFGPLKRNILLTEWKWCAVDLLCVTLSWGLVGLYAWLAHAAGSGLLIGDLFMVYQYTQQAGGVIASIAMNFQQFARMQTDYASADPIWRAPLRVAHETAMPAQWRTILIEGLAFHHGRRRTDRFALADVTLMLRRGERIALVGPSGSGKSTLMQVIAGLYEADSGTFVIDSRTDRERRHLGEIATLIPQEAAIFEASVRDNLTFGTEIAAERLQAAVELSAFDRIVQALPYGIDTIIAERGMNLSGGQRQRMALARGYIAAQSSSLILLDEPTASLDAATEAHVIAGLRTGFPDACIVCSLHRLHLLPHFDRVVLMDQGSVVDSGTVAELLGRQPLFAELWRRNGAGGAEEDSAVTAAAVA